MPIRPKLGLFWVILGAAGLALSPPSYAQQAAVVRPVLHEPNLGFPRVLDVRQVRAAHAVAMATLVRFEPAISAGNYRSLGFFTQTEIKTASFGDPLQLIYVTLDQILAYAPGNDAGLLLQSNHALFVPLRVGSEVRCAVFLKDVNNEYTGVGLGQPHLTQLIDTTVAAVSAAHDTPAQSLIIVKVPAFFQTFVGRSANGELFLTAVTTSPVLNLQAGQELPATVVFENLKRAAQDYHVSHGG